MSSDRANAPQSCSRAAAAPRHACRGLAALTGFAALGLGLWLVGLGCWGTVCTGLGWNEGLTVEVYSPDGLGNGTIEVTIEADGVPVVLAIEVDGDTAACVPNDEEGTSCASEVSVDADRRLFATIQDSSAEAIGLNLYYVDGNSLAGGPEVTHLRIARGGKTLVDATVEPEYTHEELNGEGCGFATEALVKLTVSPAGASSPP